MQNLENKQNALDLRFEDLFNKLLSLELFDEAKALNDLYFDTKTNCYKRGSKMASNIFNQHKTI